MISFHQFIWVVLFGVLSTCSHAQSSSLLEKKWKLYHSWTSTSTSAFEHRSDLKLSVDTDEASAAEIEINNADGSFKDPEWVQNWIQQNPNGLYQLKLVEENSNNELITSVPACQLLRANFREEISLRLGHKASAMSVSYVPLVSPLAPTSCSTSTADEKATEENGEGNIEWADYKFADKWESKVMYDSAVPGMTLRAVMPNYRPPPGLTFLPRVNSEGKVTKTLPGEEPKDGDKKREQEAFPTTPMGFMKKYWYIILPLLISNFMSVPPPEEEEQQGQGGAQQQQQQRQASAAPAAQQAAAGGGQRPRRGKRG